jgi:oligopeptide/dipeptide ABC transporter ATP-binding protein
MIILDEPVSALDVSVRNEILSLLDALQGESGLTYLLISHDIGAVIQIAAEVAVLYLGRLVELGAAAEVLGHPLHPYTAALIHAVPTIDGAAPHAPVRPQTDAAVVAGCPFQPRCPHAIDRCRVEMPMPRLLRRRRVACHCAEQFDNETTGVLTA